MFGLLQWGGRLCIDAVTQHNHVFSYVHSFSEFPPLNNYNTAASGPGQTLIKSLLVLCQILCGSFLLTPDLRSLYTFTINISTDGHQDTYRTDVHFVLVWFSRPVVANPSIAIYRSISQSSLSITELSELSGLTGCGWAADQLCIVVSCSNGRVSATCGGAAGLSSALPSKQVVLSTKLNTRTLRYEDVHLPVCQ